MSKLVIQLSHSLTTPSPPHNSTMAACPAVNTGQVSMSTRDAYDTQRSYRLSSYTNPVMTICGEALHR
jgi:hypothetical protein